MATVDHRTPHLDLPLPHPDNRLADDVGRIIAAIQAIDAAAHALQQAIGQLPAIDDGAESAHSLWSSSKTRQQIDAKEALPQGGTAAQVLTGNRAWTDATALPISAAVQQAIEGKLSIGQFGIGNDDLSPFGNSYTENLDTLDATGFYGAGKTPATAGRPYDDYFMVLHLSWGGASLHAEQIAYGLFSAAGVTMRRSKNNNTWGPWQGESPPTVYINHSVELQDGVDYAVDASANITMTLPSNPRIGFTTRLLNSRGAFELSRITLVRANTAHLINNKFENVVFNYAVGAVTLKYAETNRWVLGGM